MSSPCGSTMLKLPMCERTVFSDACAMHVRHRSNKTYRAQACGIARMGHRLLFAKAILALLDTQCCAALRSWTPQVSPNEKPHVASSSGLIISLEAGGGCSKKLPFGQFKVFFSSPTSSK